MFCYLKKHSLVNYFINKGPQKGYFSRLHFHTVFTDFSSPTFLVHCKAAEYVVNQVTVDASSMTDLESKAEAVIKSINTVC